MGLLGSIVGGITSAVGSVFAGKAQNKGYNQQIDMFNRRLDDIRAHRDKLYYQDPTQTAESQAAVTQAQDLLNDQTQAAEARNIVTGGTDESVALQKQAAAAAVGNMMQQQAVYGAQKKEKIYDNAEDEINAFSKYIADSKLQKGLAKGKAIADAAGGLSDAATELPW